jgi:PAS domain S-box-containing protein
MKIRNKIFLAFVVVIIVIMIPVFIILYELCANSLHKEIDNTLENESYAQTDHIISILQSYVDYSAAVSSDYYFRNLNAPVPTDIGYNSKIDSIRSELNQSITNKNKIREIDYLDLSGKVITSTDEDETGAVLLDSEGIQRAKNSTYVEDMENENNQYFIHVVSPIKQNSRITGILIIEFSTDELFTALEEHSPGWGKTGEMYLVNKNKNLISPTRLEDLPLFDTKIDNVNIQHCLQDGTSVSLTTGNISQTRTSNFIYTYNNYTNAKVTGTGVRIDELNWCIVTERGNKESFLPLVNIRNTFIVASLITIALNYLLAFFISKQISNPIYKLQKGAEIIKNGNLEYKVGMPGQDEISDLSRSFDKMTEAIKKSRAEIDIKVEQQTEDIVKQKDKLEGQQQAILNILEDVEAEKDNVTIERDKIDAIMQSIGDAVFVVNRNMEVILTNTVTAELSGIRMDELMGKKYFQVLKFQDEVTGKVVSDFINNALSSGKVQKMSNHTVLVKKDGSKTPIADSAAPLKNKNGEIIGCVVVFRDVTRERSVDKAKSEFVSLASHQLRTPLAAVKWYTEMLVNGDTGGMKKEQQEFLTEIYRSNERMIELVNSLLNVSRLELGTFSIEPESLDILQIAKDALKENMPDAKKKNMHIVTKFDKNIPKMNLDKKLTFIIFQNLISNAIKYTPAKGKVNIDIEKEGKNVVINVIDNGMGIPKEQQNKIFEKLFRADNVRKADTDGTGLGLYVVKSILDQAGGNISFKSTLNKGTTFKVEIPLTGMKEKKGTKKLD